MWLERFVIIVSSLHRDFIPGSWGMYYPTPVDIFMFVGSFGLFFTLFFLFLRFLPVIAMAEVKSVMPQAHGHLHADHDDDHNPQLATAGASSTMPDTTAGEKPGDEPGGQPGEKPGEKPWRGGNW